MIGNLLIKIIIWLLNNSKISIENRILLTNQIINKLETFPLKEIITFRADGTILVNERSLTLEASRKFREDATFLYNSTLRKIVSEAVSFKAISMAVHNGDTPEKMFFGRAAMWFLQQEEEFYKLLAKDEEEDV